MKLFLKAFCMCFGMFTALPCPYRPWDEDAREMMLVCLPIVGAVIGALWLLLSMLGLRLLPAVGAELIAALPWLLTGFIHLDGFMDTSDAILSWRPLEQRLRILKDVHTGAFAVISLAVLAMFSLGGARGLSLQDDLRVLLFIPVISRCGSSFSVLTLRPIGHSEYAKLDSRSAQRMTVAVMWAVAVAACGIWLGGRVVVLLVETLAYALAMLWAWHTLKGVSGDTAGFALSIAECAALVALANQIRLN